MGVNKRRILMKSFVTSQLSCYPPIWTFHSRNMENRIYTIHEKTLRLEYDESQHLKRQKKRQRHHYGTESISCLAPKL